MAANPAEPEFWSREDVDVLLRSRATIERAKGMLMERYGIDDAAAFAVLHRLSQHTNRKLRSIAEDLVGTGRLPVDPAGRHSN